ncbi:four-helix bundle copper-binding protein [Mycoplasmatota bacterium]|nr:four-helix bundle copper-binding protein [Mycoplasmatota bacterium]
MDFIESEYQICIDFLNDCAQACNECLDECLNAPDLKDRGELIKNLVECEIHAQMTVGFLTRKSKHAKKMALICAHLAEVTAKECENFNDVCTKMTQQVCLESASMCIKSFDNK